MIVVKSTFWVLRSALKTSARRRARYSEDTGFA